MSLWAHLEFSDLVRHLCSGSGDQSLDMVHASTEIIIPTNGFRQAGTSLAYPRMEIMALQKATFNLLKRSGIPDFRGWCGRRRTLTQGWISSKGADVAQDLWKSPSNPACWWGRGNPAYNKMFLSAEEGDDSWDEGRTKKCSAAPCVGKGRSPACHSPAHTGSHQMGHWPQAAHTPLSLGSFHLPTFRAGSRDEKAAALSLEAWAEEAGRSGEGNGCLCQLPPRLGHGWASSGATWVGGCCSSLVQVSYYHYRASIPPALNGFLVSLIPSSSLFLAHSL